MDYVGPVIGAALFILLMSLVREPARRTFNAILVAGVCGVYLNSGFGVWELLYPLIALPVAYRGLQAYRFIGLGWLMHACWADCCLVLRRCAFADRASIPRVIEGGPHTTATFTL
jgi:hypothetical protein